ARQPVIWLEPQGASDREADQLCQAMLLVPSPEVPFHSITSSARAITDGGTVRPSVLAALRFTTSSNLIGCSTGRSAGFAPLKILSTKTADRRNRSTRS